MCYKECKNQDSIALLWTFTICTIHTADVNFIVVWIDYYISGQASILHISFFFCTVRLSSLHSQNVVWIHLYWRKINNKNINTHDHIIYIFSIIHYMYNPYCRHHVYCSLARLLYIFSNHLHSAHFTTLRTSAIQNCCTYRDKYSTHDHDREIIHTMINPLICQKRLSTFLSTPFITITPASPMEYI